MWYNVVMNEMHNHIDEPLFPSTNASQRPILQSGPQKKSGPQKSGKQRFNAESALGQADAWAWGSMKQRILSHRTPTCHRRPVTAHECGRGGGATESVKNKNMRDAWTVGAMSSTCRAQEGGKGLSRAEDPRRLSHTSVSGGAPEVCLVCGWEEAALAAKLRLDRGKPRALSRFVAAGP